MAHELPELPYAQEALEPHIDSATMGIHHGKHHATYIANLNNALDGNAELEAKSIEDLISDLESVPEGIRGAVRNNGGGHANHSLFWTSMSPNGGGTPSGDLATAIDAAFGSLDEFKAAFKAAALTRFGSGWAWLVINPEKKLAVVSTSNAHNPLDMPGTTPLLACDVWEHAYYLDTQNNRASYLDHFWTVCNWEHAHEQLIKSS